MNEVLVSVGIVTWNSAGCLPACLRSLGAQRSVPFELIAVDNGSADESVDMIRHEFPEATIIKNDTNTGFCHAHNQAIQASRGRYYLPLNPDVELEPEYIHQLAQTLEAGPGIGSCAGKLLLPPRISLPHKIDSTGLFIDRARRQYLRGHGEIDQGQFDQAGEVFGVDGAAPLYRREMLEDVKIDGQYFDESFFSHKEDVDLAWRAHLLGWKCWYNPYAIAFHERNFKPGQRETISPTIKIHAVKNRYFLLAKNELSSGWIRDGSFILWYDLKILVYLCLFERSSLKAITIVWQNRKKLFHWRKEIRRRMRVAPAEILSWFR